VGINAELTAHECSSYATNAFFIQLQPFFQTALFTIAALKTWSGTTMNKLPQITLAFWVMKICATTLGETAGDLLSMTLNIGYAMSSLMLISVFLLTLVTQLYSRRYNPMLYWLVILSTSTAGTTMSDFMDRTLGLGYATGSALLIGILLRSSRCGA
jgi:uncharacterized membrane-anchored protein